MRCKRFADDGPQSGDKIQHARGQPRVVSNLREDECSEWRNFAWLQHDGATGSKRRRDLGDHLMKRKIPWSYASDDANRFFHHKRIADLFLKRVFREQLRIRVHHHRGHSGLNHRRQRKRHPHFACDDRSYLVLTHRKASRNLLEKSGALGCCATGVGLDPPVNIHTL